VELNTPRRLNLKQKYCKNCLLLYIKYTTDNNTCLDTYIITNSNAQCIEHKANRNNFNTMNIQEWCEYCSEISYFRQVISNITSLNNDKRYLTTLCIHLAQYDCERCNKWWSTYLFEHGKDCYQISSGWVESTLTKKSISTLYFTMVGYL
jgi:hypothetical protein